MLKIILRDEEDRQNILAQYDLPPAYTLQKMIVAILEHEEREGTPIIKIKLKLNLVPDSYHIVPSMFARSMASRIGYPYFQAVKRKSFMVVYAGEEPFPRSFRSRALQAIRTEGIFTCSRLQVPRSYRRRPSLFGKILSEATTQSICNGCKRNKLYWKVDNSN